MQLLAKTVTGKVVSVECEEHDTIATLRDKIGFKSGFRPLGLVFAGKFLGCRVLEQHEPPAESKPRLLRAPCRCSDEERTLGDYNIQKGSVVHIVLRLRNGDDYLVRLPSGEVVRVALQPEESGDAAIERIRREGELLEGEAKDYGIKCHGGLRLNMSKTLKEQGALSLHEAESASPPMVLEIYRRADGAAGAAEGGAAGGAGSSAAAEGAAADASDDKAISELLAAAESAKGDAAALKRAEEEAEIARGAAEEGAAVAAAMPAAVAALSAAIADASACRAAAKRLQEVAFQAQPFQGSGGGVNYVSAGAVADAGAAAALAAALRRHGGGDDAFLCVALFDTSAAVAASCIVPHRGGQRAKAAAVVGCSALLRDEDEAPAPAAAAAAADGAAAAEAAENIPFVAFHGPPAAAAELAAAVLTAASKQAGERGTCCSALHALARIGFHTVGEEWGQLKTVHELLYCPRRTYARVFEALAAGDAAGLALRLLREHTPVYAGPRSSAVDGSALTLCERALAVLAAVSRGCDLPLKTVTEAAAAALELCDSIAGLRHHGEPHAAFPTVWPRVAVALFVVSRNSAGAHRREVKALLLGWSGGASGMDFWQLFFLALASHCRGVGSEQGATALIALMHDMIFEPEPASEPEGGPGVKDEALCARVHAEVGPAVKEAFGKLWHVGSGSASGIGRMKEALRLALE